MTEVQFNEHVHLLLIGLILSFVAFWVASRRDFFTYPNQFSAPMIHLTEVLGAFAVFIGISLVFMPLLGIGYLLSIGKDASSSSEPHFQGWFNATTIIASAAGIYIYFKSLPVKTQMAVMRKTFSEGFYKRLQDFLMGSYAWLISFPTVIVIGQLVSLMILSKFPDSHIDQVAVKFLKSTMQYPFLFTLTAFLLVAVVPAIEEFLFRGFLQTWLKQYFNVNIAIIVTSLIFSSFHFSYSQGLSNIELLTSLFVLSCFLGFLYERQQSILASIGLHSTFNLISVIFLLSES